MEEITEMISQLPFGQAVQRNITNLPDEIKDEILSKTTGIVNQTETSADINEMREANRGIRLTSPPLFERIERLADNLEARSKSKTGLRKILEGRPYIYKNITDLPNEIKEKIISKTGDESVENRLKLSKGTLERDIDEINEDLDATQTRDEGIQLRNKLWNKQRMLNNVNQRLTRVDKRKELFNRILEGRPMGQ